MISKHITDPAVGTKGVRTPVGLSPSNSAFFVVSDQNITILLPSITQLRARCRCSLGSKSSSFLPNRSDTRPIIGLYCHFLSQGIIAFIQTRMFLFLWITLSTISGDGFRDYDYDLGRGDVGGLAKVDTALNSRFG